MKLQITKSNNYKCMCVANKRSTKTPRHNLDGFCSKYDMADCHKIANSPRQNDQIINQQMQMRMISILMFAFKLSRNEFSELCTKLVYYSICCIQTTIRIKISTNCNRKGNSIYKPNGNIHGNVYLVVVNSWFPYSWGTADGDSEKKVALFWPLKTTTA